MRFSFSNVNAKPLVYTHVDLNCKSFFCKKAPYFNRAFVQKRTKHVGKLSKLELFYKRDLTILVYMNHTHTHTHTNTHTIVMYV
mmetsp:Transcript_90084/g.131832  ORF Transcript_90084/g.131832 Transcript_90084/m.131832 type:complete len:84 (+) Transcript_90084:309-560(+)